MQSQQFSKNLLFRIGTRDATPESAPLDLNNELKFVYGVTFESFKTLELEALLL